jgi:hypothetical protein
MLPVEIWQKFSPASCFRSQQLLLKAIPAQQPLPTVIPPARRRRDPSRPRIFPSFVRERVGLRSLPAVEGGGISLRRLAQVTSVSIPNSWLPSQPTAQNDHSERSGAAFSSSFASANELRHAVEESPFISRLELLPFPGVQ